MKLLPNIVNYGALMLILFCHSTVAFAHEEVAGSGPLLVIFHMLTAPDHVAMISLFAALVFLLTRRERARRKRAWTWLRILNRKKC